MDRYVNWSSTAMSKDDFYTDWQCRQMYKAHLKVFTGRKNTVNGRLYREDPTIFYWDLMNEPRWCARMCSLHVSSAPPEVVLHAAILQWRKPCCPPSIMVLEVRLLVGWLPRVLSKHHCQYCATLDCFPMTRVLTYCWAVYAARSTGCGFALQQWVEEMSVFMKAIDPNHLVTLGEEGFYSTTCERCAAP